MTPNPPAATAAALADDLAHARVVRADLLDSLLAEFPGGSAADLADFLVARRALTRFQADRALAGAARSLALGPYRLTGRHRPGALGPAFDAEKTGRGAPEPVVFVRVPQRSLWRAKQARDLARRAAALRRHPAVVPLIDADSANGFHFLVWAPAFGDRLSDRVAAAGPLPPGKVAEVLAQLAAGLAACHAAGLAHGLLSPASVALPTGGAPARVLDLGAGLVIAADLAGGERLLDTATAGRALAQFLPFAAPEWLAAPGTPTPAADQFSLGAVGYFALTGRPPSPTGDGPVVVTGMNPDLAVGLDRMLATDPADRFTGLDEAHAALSAAADDADAAGLVAPPSGLEPPPLTGGASRGGSGSLGGVQLRPADRDDTDDSIRFDLPDEVGVPELNGPPPDTPVSPRLPARAPRPAATPPPAPRPAPEDRVPSVATPPRLPAAPLVAGPTPSGGVAAAPARAPAAPPSPPPLPVPDPDRVGGVEATAAEGDVLEAGDGDGVGAGVRPAGGRPERGAAGDGVPVPAARGRQRGDAGAGVRPRGRVARRRGAGPRGRPRRRVGGSSGGGRGVGDDADADGGVARQPVPGRLRPAGAVGGAGRTRRRGGVGRPRRRARRQGRVPAGCDRRPG